MAGFSLGRWECVIYEQKVQKMKKITHKQRFSNFKDEDTGMIFIIVILRTIHGQILININMEMEQVNDRHRARRPRMDVATGYTQVSVF